MELELLLLAGGFLLGLLVGRWWAVPNAIVFGLFMWSLWSQDREVNAAAIGLVFGGFPTVGATIGLLVRAVGDAGWRSGARQRARRWLRLAIGLDSTTPESDRGDRQR